VYLELRLLLQAAVACNKKLTLSKRLSFASQMFDCLQILCQITCLLLNGDCDDFN